MSLKYLEQLNDEQLKAVKVKNNSAISAGAGSGKTRVLAKRFVYLILERNIPVEKIVALTFTKKAATEMYERIYSEIIDVKNYLTEANKIKVLEKALENFSKTNISTIDSFCGSIARSGCTQFGIAPDFIIDEDAVNKIIKTNSLNFFLENRDNKYLIELIGNTSIDNFISNLLEAFLRLGTITKPINIEACKKLFDKNLNELFQNEIKIFKTHTDIILRCPDFDKPDDKITEAKNILAMIDTYPKSLEDKNFDAFLQMLNSLSEINLSGGTSSDEIKKNVRASIKFIRDKYAKSDASTSFKLIKDFYNSRELNFSIFDLLDELQKDVINQKRMQGVFNYADVAQLAIDCLLCDKDLRTFYKNEYDIIMIDEFQDNNSLQRDLLFLLSEKKDLHSSSIPKAKDLTEDKLFFVGDDKQSIYLFRGADVSVFKKLSDEFSKNENINLNTNYRTEKKLIQFFNDSFSQVFYSKNNLPNEIDDDYLAHEANFTEITPNRETAGVNPSVNIFFASEFKDKDMDETIYLDSKETEAFVIAKKISEMIENKITVRDSKTGKARACKYSDFAILFRATTNQTIVERFLRLVGVPYKAEQQKGIFYDAPINDLLAIIKLALYPDDKLVYSQVLRSPFVNINDLLFTKILFATNENTEAFAKNLCIDFSDEEGTQYNNARNFFLRVKQYVAENSCAEIISKLWYDEGYRYLLLQNPEYQRYMELYDYIFEIARLADANSLSVGEFVEQVEAYIQNEEKLNDMEIPVSTSLENQNTVKLLTIHKSKGLEFPIVCLPYAASRGRTNRLESKIFYSEKYGLSINIENENKKNNNIFYNILSGFEKFKNDAELKRLLYVALTRAESHIIMTGISSYKKAVKGSFFSLMPDFFGEDDGLNFSSTDILKRKNIEPIKRSEAYSNASKVKIKKLDKNFLQDEVKVFSNAAKKYFTASHLNDTEFEKIISEDKYFNKRFEITKDESENISPSDLGILTHNAIEASFENKKINLPEKEKLNILKWMDNFFNSELGKLSKSASFRKTEYGFITKYKNKTVVGKADLIFKNGNDLYIVDYKTDTIENPKNHIEQLSVYKEACAELFSIDKKNIKAFIFYLRSGNAVEV
ncbi:MAG: UvrD-helicase domain-containing protein [Treponemataceae bacterium]